MSQNAVGRRPGYITLIVVLSVISGVVGVLGGLAIILTRNNADIENAVERAARTSVSPTTLLILGILQLVIGLVYLGVARGLARGSNGSRVLVMVVSALSVVSGVWTFTQATGQGRISAVVGIVGALIIIGLLNTARSKAFFGVA